MLPNPATSRAKNRHYFPSLQPVPNHGSIGWLNHLRARTRLTNLAVFLLICVLSLSLLFNVSFILSSTSTTVHKSGSWSLSTAQQVTSNIPPSIETTIERDVRYTQLKHLIMVPGHAIWLGHDANRVEEDSEWVLEAMQRGGSVKTYIKHIRRGVQELSEDPHSLLVFSGGATRKAPSPPTTEAQSYLSLSHALGLLHHSPPDPDPKAPLPLNLRTATEEFALDSYENLLFALARFHEVTGTWPDRVTVVGYGMKRKRFEELHRHAIGFPRERFEYIGIDDEGDTTEHYAGENKYGYTPFISSPSGCHPPLSTKRLLRNPYFKYHPYHTSSPELIDLLEWCPPYHVPNPHTPESERWKHVPVFHGSLPWRSAIGDETHWGREKD